jgi:hypothetical protein
MLDGMVVVVNGQITLPKILFFFGGGKTGNFSFQGSSVISARGWF